MWNVWKVFLLHWLRLHAFLSHLAVQTILQEGTNPNRADEKGRAAIHFGVTKGHKEIGEYVLSFPVLA